MASLPDRRLDELYDGYAPRLYRYALFLLGDREGAEDAVHEAFYRLARLRGRAADAVNVAYATRAIRNECYTMLRRRRRATVSAEPVLEPAAPGVSEEERLIVEQALRALPAEQRDVVYLKVYAGLSFQEIASVSDVSINTAASRYRYALAALRRILQPAVE